MSGGNIFAHKRSAAILPRILVRRLAVGDFCRQCAHIATFARRIFGGDVDGYAFFGFRYNDSLNDGATIVIQKFYIITTSFKIFIYRRFIFVIDTNTIRRNTTHSVDGDCAVAAALAGDVRHIGGKFQYACGRGDGVGLLSAATIGVSDSYIIIARLQTRDILAVFAVGPLKIVTRSAARHLQLNAARSAAGAFDVMHISRHLDARRRLLDLRLADKFAAPLIDHLHRVSTGADVLNHALHGIVVHPKFVRLVAAIHIKGNCTPRLVVTNRMIHLRHHCERYFGC